MIDRTLAGEGRAPSVGLMVVMWTTVVLTLAVGAAAVLVRYGAVVTLVALLVEEGFVAASARADQRALGRHALLWDPWFPVWGLLLLAAQIRSQPVRRRRR